MAHKTTTLRNAGDTAPSKSPLPTRSNNQGLLTPRYQQENPGSPIAYAWSAKTAAPSSNVG